MNFSRSAIGAASPISNRFVAALLATLAALMISIFGSGQWASADAGTTVPGPGPEPPTDSTLSAPRHVMAKPGDKAAAVGWIEPAGDVAISGYVVTVDPSGIIVETGHDDTLVIVEGLENGVEYTFTVVAFNDAGVGEVSEPSSPVVPEEGLELDEEQLERLREHLRKLVRKARQRLHDAKERASEKLEKTRDRVGEKLGKQTDRADEFVEKAISKTDEHHARQVEKAHAWFERLKAQIARKLERAKGTDRYDEVLERSEEVLRDARAKLEDRIERSGARAEARIEKAEEMAEHRIEKATERAENVVERTESRLTRRIEEIKDRLHTRLRHLVRAWVEWSGSDGEFD
ncbi:MAG: fibronectin type III domain-containing protein [Dehalococcoidia bacterium]|jgi:ElaB/YqjD/DUF883 family membrane-anchored ribosome-binding protein|nr:fibronectin type III domain-containing protein [Dehalococcoidia bacterium]